MLLQELAGLINEQLETSGPRMDISTQDIESLENEEIPDTITGNFYCSNNKLKNLKGAPKKVDGNFLCDANSLTSLEGTPTKIKGNYACQHNNLTSLQGIHKLFKGGYISSSITLTGNPIKSHILGLILIPQLTKIRALHSDDFYEATKIISKHLAGDRDVIDCQQELIEAGFKTYAQL